MALFDEKSLRIIFHFSSFCAEIQTQFGKPIQILRSDNAKEYVSGNFQKYMLEQGILNQTSCIDTPSQNGVLSGNNPCHTLFPNKQLFPIALKIFSCTCFVRDVHPQVKKLDRKFLKCMFLRYSRLQKGYRCYCQSLGKYIVSTGVTFLEKIPLCSGTVSQGEDDLLIYNIIPNLSPPTYTLVKPPIKYT